MLALKRDVGQRQLGVVVANVERDAIGKLSHVLESI
jgi:hypothetical protein